jgi:hypothetical protein
MTNAMTSSLNLTTSRETQIRKQQNLRMPRLGISNEFQSYQGQSREWLPQTTLRASGSVNISGVRKNLCRIYFLGVSTILVNGTLPTSTLRLGRLQAIGGRLGERSSAHLMVPPHYLQNHDHIQTKQAYTFVLEIKIDGLLFKITDVSETLHAALPLTAFTTCSTTLIFMMTRLPRFLLSYKGPADWMRKEQPAVKSCQRSTTFPRLSSLPRVMCRNITIIQSGWVKKSIQARVLIMKIVIQICHSLY